MAVVKVSSKGQVVIPKELRKKYGIKPETEVLISDVNGKIVVAPLLEDAVRQSKGVLKGGRSLTKALLAARKLEREQDGKKIRYR